MVAILPYPWQLPKDIAAKSVPTPTPVPPTPVVPPSPILITPPVVEPPYTVQDGGPYYGDTPPANPYNGWIWINTANNGMYVFTDPGVWTQIGTNW
jgi:hypothetical protein